jgi:hypothetical protein
LNKYIIYHVASIEVDQDVQKKITVNATKEDEYQDLPCRPIQGHLVLEGQLEWDPDEAKHDEKDIQYTPDQEKLGLRVYEKWVCHFEIHRLISSCTGPVHLDGQPSRPPIRSTRDGRVRLVIIIHQHFVLATAFTTYASTAFAGSAFGGGPTDIIRN